MSDSTFGSRPLATPSASASVVADHADAGEHVVADLGGLAGAVGAGVDDVAAHRLEDRSRPLEVLGVAADHEGQGAGLGADRAAGDRRVDHLAAVLLTSSASSRVTEIEMVLLSMNSVPGAAAASRPPLPG